MNKENNENNENKTINETKDIEKILRTGKKVCREALINKKLEEKIKKFSSY